MGDSRGVDENIKESEHVDAEDEFGAGKAEIVIPNVNDELKPKVNMKFDSLDKGTCFTINMHSQLGLR